jgi:fidgetin-like protein 1
MAPRQLTQVGALCIGYSGADLRALCTEAAYGPIRSFSDIATLESSQVRAIGVRDFEDSLKHVRPSVSPADLVQYVKWNDTYGSFHESDEEHKHSPAENQ